MDFWPLTSMFSVERDFTTAVNDIFDAYRLQEQGLFETKSYIRANQKTYDTWEFL